MLYRVTLYQGSTVFLSKCINYNEKTKCFDCGTCQKSYEKITIDLAVCRLASGGPWSIQTDVAYKMATGCYCRPQRTCSGNPFQDIIPGIPGLTRG